MTTNGTRSRILEDVGFGAAILLGVIYGVAEALARVGVRIGEHAPDASFPWGLLIVMAVLAAPKTVGRASAGRVWDAVAGMLPGRRSGGGPGAAG
jgi:hypothetical protein